MKFIIQICYNPRYQDNFGLTDGEVMERMWSYLRRFSRMTKEMRPSHRVDVLSDALLYYGRQSANNLSTYIMHMHISNNFARNVEIFVG